MHQPARLSDMKGISAVQSIYTPKQNIPSKAWQRYWLIFDNSSPPVMRYYPGSSSSHDSSGSHDNFDNFSSHDRCRCGLYLTSENWGFYQMSGVGQTGNLPGPLNGSGMSEFFFNALIIKSTRVQGWKQWKWWTCSRSNFGGVDLDLPRVENGSTIIYSHLHRSIKGSLAEKLPINKDSCIMTLYFRSEYSVMGGE